MYSRWYAASVTVASHRMPPIVEERNAVATPIWEESMRFITDLLVKKIYNGRKMKQVQGQIIKIERIYRFIMDVSDDESVI